MKKIYLLFTVLSISFCLMSCEFFTSSKDENSEPKKSGFNDPEEFVENPSIAETIDDSNIDTNNGDDPPPLVGTYKTIGSITDASSNFSSVIGMSLSQSTFIIYDQTTLGRIKI